MALQGLSWVLSGLKRRLKTGDLWSIDSKQRVEVALSLQHGIENKPGVKAGLQTEFQRVLTASEGTDRGVSGRVGCFGIDVAKVKHALKTVPSIVPEPAWR